MSTNCIRCGKKDGRTGIDLLCNQCREKSLQWSVDGEYREDCGQVSCRIMSHGYEVGRWIDNDWNGLSPTAYLIAAAPMMLEACRLIVGIECGPNALGIEMLEAAKDAAREAIKKANLDGFSKCKKS